MSQMREVSTSDGPLFCCIYGRRQRCVFWVSVVIGALLLGGGIFLLEFIPGFAKSRVESLMTIKNPQAKLYPMFRNLSAQTTVRYTFRFFNVTNVHDLMYRNESLPVLTEVGPYVYIEEKWRPEDRMQWLPNGTIRHFTYVSYRFVREESVGPDTDIIAAPRVGLFVFMQTIAQLPGELSRNITATLLTNEQFFAMHSVSELVLGYRDPFLVRVQDALSFLGPNVVPTLVNFLTELNETTSVESEVYHGGAYSSTAPFHGINYAVYSDNWMQHGPPQYRLGDITMFRGMRNLSCWLDPRSNMINGTDGTLFNPYLPVTGDSRPIYVFVDTLSRSVGLLHSDGDDDDLNSIELHNYRIDGHGQLAIPSNAGFGVKENGFQPRPPIQNVPYEHIYTAFTKWNYLDCNTTMVKVKMPRPPDRARDDTIVGVEPHTGAAMKVFKRVQFNVRLRPAWNLTHLAHISETWIPVLQAQEWSVVPESVQRMVLDECLIPLRVAHASGIALIAVGGALLLLGPIAAIILSSRASQSLGETAHLISAEEREHRRLPREGDSTLTASSMTSAGAFAVNRPQFSGVF